MYNIEDIINNIKNMNNSDNIDVVVDCYINALNALEGMYKSKVESIVRKENDG